jgi:LPS O-antigen subunit length determinant protein (WzzB/FepE family)
MHTKKCDNENIADGSLLETGSYIIEVSGPVPRPDVRKANIDQEDVPVLVADYDCDLEEDEPCFDLLYTKDTKKKTKKWVDGYLQYNKKTTMAKFYGEDGKILFKRHVLWRQIDEQEELATARFIFQIGAHREGPIETAAIGSETKPAKHYKQTDGIEEVELSEADLRLFVEHSASYTADTQKKAKTWLDGHLWYESGICKVFDEDGKEIYKSNI